MKRWRVVFTGAKFAGPLELPPGGRFVTPHPTHHLETTFTIDEVPAATAKEAFEKAAVHVEILVGRYFNGVDRVETTEIKRKPKKHRPNPAR